MKSLLIILVFVTLSFGSPIPKERKNPTITIVGVWDLQWGSIQQVVTVDGDGNYSSPPFGDGKYIATIDKDGNCVMSFNENKNHYKMIFDPVNNTGVGEHVNGGHIVPVYFKPRLQ